MKIIIGDLPTTVPPEVIQNRINEYHKRGRDLKTRIRNNRIELYYIDEDDNV